MPRFSANLSFLFNEVPFLERFGEAAHAGFRAVEFAFGFPARFLIHPAGGNLVAEVVDLNLLLIGFAGARVGAGTIGVELPPGFQRSEFLFQHGFLDRIVARPDLRGELAQILRYLAPQPVESRRG